MITTNLNELEQYAPHVSLVTEEEWTSLKGKILREEVSPYIARVDGECYEYTYKESPDSNIFTTIIVTRTDHELLQNQAAELVRTGVIGHPLSCFQNIEAHIPTHPRTFIRKLQTTLSRWDLSEWCGDMSYHASEYEELNTVFEHPDLVDFLKGRLVTPLVRYDTDGGRFIYHILDFDTVSKTLQILKIAVDTHAHYILLDAITQLFNTYYEGDTEWELNGYSKDLFYFYSHLEDVVEASKEEPQEEHQEIPEELRGIADNPAVESVIEQLPKSNINEIRRRLGMPVDETVEETEISREENAYGSTVIKQVYLPANSETLRYKEHVSRFSGAMWFNQIQQISAVLAGLGGIGSYVAFLLSRLNIQNLTVFDDDAVDSSNMSGQLYSIDDVGNPKTMGVYNMARKYADYYRVSTRCRKFTEDDFPEDVMICGFDNMAARKVFYNSWKQRVDNKAEDNKKKCLFIDGRLAAEDFQVLCIVGNHPIHMQRYEEKYLFTDEEADQTVCSYKQTSFCANMIASVMVNLFVNFVANLCHPIINRALPFYTEYDGQFMTLKTSY